MPNGSAAFFIEEGDGIRQLLQQLESTEASRRYRPSFRGLLGIWPAGVRKPQDALEEGLTERAKPPGRTGLSNKKSASACRWP